MRAWPPGIGWSRVGAKVGVLRAPTSPAWWLRNHWRPLRPAISGLSVALLEQLLSCLKKNAERNPLLRELTIGPEPTIVRPGVPVTQINLHHSKDVWAILVKSMTAMRTGIALIQEPWLLKNAIKGLSGCGTICYTRSNRKIRTCIATKGLTAIFMPQLSCENLTVIQTKLKFSTTESLDVLISSAYMPYDSVEPPPQVEINNLITYAEERGLGLLLGCDANSHHVGWGSSDINSRGESLHDFIMRTSLIILNRGTEFTFQDSRRQEIIDITLCTKRMAGLVTDWRVLNKSSGSAHRQIRLTLCHISEDNRTRNPKRTDWDEYRAALSASLKSVSTKFFNKNDLDAAALFMKSAIIDAYEANSPLRRSQSSTTVPWWSKELTKLRLRTRRLFNKAKNSGSAACWETFRSAQRKYNKPITSAERQSWRNFCESMESLPEASRLNRILSSDSRLQMGCLKHPNGHYTENLTESLTLLMETHFPGFQPLTSQHPSSKALISRNGYKPRE
ncbi:uncharacterized protein [Anoplolepis gracilipes]|uniref:uncharacterized protein n=1 Tax=Anoplolepis gracilipes TaxID=354296 RepID=UPI003BA3B220